MMYNQPYFIPQYLSYGAQPMMRGAMNIGLGNAIRGASASAPGISRGLGLFSRLGSSLQSLKTINWGNLITNTSKTLNVVNQAIPIVKQVGPMVSNMKSMLRVASLFKDETDPKPKVKRINNNNFLNASKDIYTTKDTSPPKRQENINYNSLEEDNSPTFFIPV